MVELDGMDMLIVEWFVVFELGLVRNLALAVVFATG